MFVTYTLPVIFPDTLITQVKGLIGVQQKKWAYCIHLFKVRPFVLYAYGNNSGKIAPISPYAIYTKLISCYQHSLHGGCMCKQRFVKAIYLTLPLLTVIV